MTGFESFSPVAISASIVANLATDMLTHFAPGIEHTLAGRALKRVGLIEPNFHDRLHDVLNKSLTLYFDKHPEYRLLAVINFLRDSRVAQQIGAYILDQQPYNHAIIQQALDEHLHSNNVSAALFEQRKLRNEAIFPDFLEAYRRVLNEQLSVPTIALLHALHDLQGSIVETLRQDLAEFRAYIDQLTATQLSTEALQQAYQTQQQQIATEFVEELQATGLAQADHAQHTLHKRLTPLPMLFAEGLCKGRPLQINADQYFVAHGFDHTTLVDWRNVLSETLVRADAAPKPLTPYFAGDTLLGGFRLCGISAKICTSRFSVFLLPPAQDRNIYLELGIAIGMGVPFFLIQHYAATIPPVLQSLSRYTKGGLFRTMRRELAGQIEEYDFGVVRYVAPLSTAGSTARYLIASGGTIEDEEFAENLADAVHLQYPHLSKSLIGDSIAGSASSEWSLDQLVTTIQTARFGLYRVDDTCSPTTFLALGISIGLNRPSLLLRKADARVPSDLDGLSVYAFPNFTTLATSYVPTHAAFFERYAR